MDSLLIVCIVLYVLGIAISVGFLCAQDGREFGKFELMASLLWPVMAIALALLIIRVTFFDYGTTLENRGLF